jgi:hypothetical protein
VRIIYTVFLLLLSLSLGPNHSISLSMLYVILSIFDVYRRGIKAEMLLPHFQAPVILLLYYLVPLFFYQSGFLYLLDNLFYVIFITLNSILSLSLGSLIAKRIYSKSLCYGSILYENLKPDPVNYNYLYYVSGFVLFLRIILVLSGVALDVTVSGSYTGFLAPIGIVADWLSYLAFSLLALKLVNLFQANRTSVKSFVFASSFLILQALSLSKGKLFLYFYTLFAILVIRSSSKVTRKIISLTILLLALFPFFVQFSQSVREGISVDLNDYYLGLSMAVGRLNMIEPFSRSLNISFEDLLSQYPLNNTIFPFVIAVLVPKFLWPERPSSSIGGEVGVATGYTEFSTETEVSISLPAEIFHNFPSAYLLFWLLYGFIICFFIIRLLDSGSPYSLVLAAFVSYSLIFTGLESYFALRVSFVIKFILVSLPIYSFLIKRRGF